MYKIKLAHILSLALAVLVVGCTADHPREVTGGPDARRDQSAATNTNMNTVNANTTTASATNVTVADIVSSPAAYNGRTVTVTSSVEHAYGPRVFRLDEDAVLRGGIDNDLLVITENANMPAVNNEWLIDKATVTGVVRNLIIADVEREYGLDLDSQLEIDFRNKPVLIASSVRRIED